MLKKGSYDEFDSQAKFRARTFRQRIMVMSSLKIILLLVFFSLLLPFVAILLFMGTATVFKHQWIEKDGHGTRTKLPERPQKTTTNVKSNVVEESPLTKQNNAAATLSSSSLPSGSAASHFLVESKSILLQTCIEKATRKPKKAKDLVENTATTVRVGGAAEHAVYQLCFADDHDHQHTFKIKTRSLAPDVDCNLYLSASSVSPGRSNWEWKSDAKGPDDITLHSYMEEFQAASLNALFITVAWKDGSGTGSGSGRKPVSGDKCELTIEVSTLPNDELLHKLGTLRGGQVLLPRDIERIKTTGDIRGLSS